MEILIGVLGVAVGTVVGATVWGAVVRRETAARYEQKLNAQFTDCENEISTLKMHQTNELFDLGMQHTDEMKRLEEIHAKEKVAEYQRGKESDGVVRDAKSGRMASVKPKAARKRAAAK